MAQEIRPSLRSRTGGWAEQRTEARAATFMIVFLASGFIISLFNPALLRAPAQPLLDGSWTTAYQRDFDAESPLLKPATTTWGMLEYTLFKQGRPGVLVGENDWLFSTEEFEVTLNEDDQPALDEDLSAIADIRQRLRSDGVELMVVVLPAKARLYPERLGRYQLPAAAQDRYAAALHRLEELEVHVVDPLRPLLQEKGSSQLFLRTDTHWTPEGARVVALAIADQVERTGQSGWLGSRDFGTSRQESETVRGDLTEFLPLGPFYDWVGPRDDRISIYRTESNTPSSNDLLAKVTIPVTLVGTSYSEDERWNFAGALREALGSDILNAARRGEGPFRPMFDYLDGEAYRSTRPDLIVWEIPERYLGASR